MKRLTSILIAVMFLASCGPTVLTDTPEHTAEAVYNVVTANDAEALLNLLLTKEEIEQFMLDNEIENMEARMAEVNELYGKLPRILTLVRTVGKQSGINWESTEMVSIAKQDSTEERADDSLVYDVKFSSEGEEFTLNVFMTETPKGWRLTGPPTASWIELE
jgi:PBP1b-binding outer membrane lipoprotein LpoB